MGRYLNSSTPYALYQGETNQPYFVDKSLLLAELFPVLDAGNQHICITRPRRFGKTIMTNMIAAFLSKKVDSLLSFYKCHKAGQLLHPKSQNIHCIFLYMPYHTHQTYLILIHQNILRLEGFLSYKSFEHMDGLLINYLRTG